MLRACAYCKRNTWAWYRHPDGVVLCLVCLAEIQRELDLAEVWLNAA